MDEIPQIKKPGRRRPYVTVVDTGLAVAATNLLAGIIVYHAEGDFRVEDWLDRIEVVQRGLAAEIGAAHVLAASTAGFATAREPW